LAFSLAGGLIAAGTASADPDHNTHIDYQHMVGYHSNGYHPSYQRLTQYDN
jgi:hypothetical protein